MIKVPVCEKYTLTINDAAANFNIGEKKLRRIAEEKDDDGNTPVFSICSGNRYLIIREVFEQYMMEAKVF